MRSHCCCSVAAFCRLVLISTILQLCWCDDRSIKVDALGQTARLRSLYNMKTFTVEYNIFKEEIPESTFYYNEIHLTTYHVQYANTLSEKRDFINLDASLSLAVLSSLIQISGLAEYLNEVSENSELSQISYISRVTTMDQFLKCDTATLDSYYSLETLGTTEATHVITGTTHR